MPVESPIALNQEDVQFLREANIILKFETLAALAVAGYEAYKGDALGTVVALGFAAIAKLFERATSGPKPTI